MAKSKGRTGAVSKKLTISASARKAIDQPQVWEIELTSTSSSQLAHIKDERVRKKIAERIDGLERDPGKKGKELHGELRGYRSLRVVGQRYRIIYRVDEDRVIVVVISLGIRKDGNRDDVYTLTKKLLKLGLLSD